MLLPQLHLPSIIDSSSADMAQAFLVPALSASVGYDRGVGFFSDIDILGFRPVKTKN
jgi:hypothetical protein